MSATLKPGWRKWSGKRDASMQRTFVVSHLVRVERGDGPYVVMNCPGLPTPGQAWNFGTDYDVWAWCTAEMDVKPHQEREGDWTEWWVVEQTFSTRPPTPAQQRCNENQIEDPLMEAPKVSGGFNKGKEEATKDRFGLSIITSSHEMIRGPQNEWDKSKPTIKIEQNVAALELDLLCLMIDTVNVFPIWNCPARTVKLSNITWEKLYYGTCNVYYKRSFEFEVDFKTWDRDILDEGTKALRGHWDAGDGHWVLDPISIDPGTLLPSYGDRFNPNHFDRYKDRNGENCRVILDGLGKPHDPTVDIVMTCAQSPTGAPEAWIVNGFPEANYQIDYVSGCIWGDVGLDINLNFTGGLWVLHNLLDYPDSEWVGQPENWHDMGPNEMIRMSGALGPAVVTVTRFETAPGKIHVEKYNGADFTLLGIPLVF